MRRTLAAAVVAAYVTCAGFAALADDTTHRHKGFFLRLDGEGGYISSSANQSGTSASIQGGGGGIGVGIGGALSENVILFFHVYDAIAINPQITIGSQTASTQNTSAGTFGYGVGLSYYFMPANLYLSATLAVTVLAFSSNGRDSSTNPGPGGRIAIGKEWWVGDHWGIGVAGQLSFASNQDKGTNPPTWTTWAPTIAFSATFN
jgi:hypothetical protein